MDKVPQTSATAFKAQNSPTNSRIGNQGPATQKVPRNAKGQFSKDPKKTMAVYKKKMEKLGLKTVNTGDLLTATFTKRNPNGGRDMRLDITFNTNGMDHTVTASLRGFGGHDMKSGDAVTVDEVWQEFEKRIKK